jgi:hypothetical protein
MLAMALLAAALVAAIALTPAVGPSALSYIVLAGLTGAVAPPFTGWTRASLAARLRGPQLRSALTVDNIFEESAFIVGPLLAGVVIAVATPAACLVVGGGISLSSGALAREWTPPRRDRGESVRGSLNSKLALAFACMAGMGAGIGFFEVAVAAFADAEGARGSAGVIFAALSVGGILGALAYGGRSWRGSTARQYAVLLALLGAGLLALSVPETVGGIAVVAAIGGLAFTPVFIANSLLIEEYSPAGPGAVSFAWVTTAMNAGVAAGAAVCGGLVDAHGTDPAFVAAGGVVLASAAAALLLEPPFAAPRRG